MTKKYYLFFSISSERENKYAIIYAPNITKARLIAYEKYGNQSVASLTGNEEYAKNKIALLKYTELEQ